MLLNDSLFDNLPIGSIRSSGRIGLVTRMVINPNNLHIDAFICKIARGHEQLLMPMDIRDLSTRGIVINDHDNLLEFDDAIRLKSVLKINFELINKVAYVGKRRVGKVDSFAINSDNLFIQKIYVRPGILGQLSTDRLTFDRSMVKEVTDSKIFFIPDNKVRDKVSSSVKKLTDFAAPQPSVNASFTSENE